MTIGDIQKYQKFWFEGCSWAFVDEDQSLEVEMNYSLDKQLKFTESLLIPVSTEQWKKVDQEALAKTLKMMFIIGGISYYKTFLPKKMAGLVLDAEQAEFWTKVYQRGLGEFFYQNKIDFRELINFPVTTDDAARASSSELKERCLVPIGGGKDSIVTAELLKKSGLEMELFSLREAEPIRATSEIIGKPRMIVQRKIDPLLFKLNEDGVYNGHVPITAYISCLTAVCAVLLDYKYVVFSLEKSANFGQLNFHGMDINHQYSKSEEFEGDFRKYLKKYVHDGIEFFSMLRGWNELRIAQVFAELQNFEKFAPVFTSCNANFKIVKEKSKTLWCGHCPKCLFVFLILAPFVERSKLLEIFGQNLLENEDLLELFEEILGVKNFKPFECVGTPEESRVALWMLSQKKEWKGDFLVKHFAGKLLTEFKNKDWEKEREKVLAFSEENFIPERFNSIMKDI